MNFLRSHHGAWFMIWSILIINIIVLIWVLHIPWIPSFFQPNIYLQNLCIWGQRTIFLEFMMTRCDRNCLLFDNFSPVTGACWCWMCWMSQDLINPDSALISRLSPASVGDMDCGKRIAHWDVAGGEQIVVNTQLQFCSCLVEYFGCIDNTAADTIVS